jgi:hypothetical protein
MAGAESKTLKEVSVLLEDSFCSGTDQQRQKEEEKVEFLLRKERYSGSSAKPLIVTRPLGKRSFRPTDQTTCA